MGMGVGVSVGGTGVVGTGVIVPGEAGPMISFANTFGNSQATERLPSMPGPWAYSIFMSCTPDVNGTLAE